MSAVVRIDSKFNNLSQFTQWGVFLCLVFMPLLWSDIFWDDQLYFTNSYLDGVQSPWSFFSPNSEHFRAWPLFHVCLWWLKKTIGTNIVALRLLSLSIHFLNARLVVELAKRIQIKNFELAGLIFFLHPMNIEVLHSVLQIPTLLSGFFLLVTLLLLLPIEKRRRPLSHSNLVAMASMGLSILLKPIGLGLMFFCVILNWRKMQWREKAFLSLLILLGFTIFMKTQDGIEIRRSEHFYASNYLFVEQFNDVDLSGSSGFASEESEIRSPQNYETRLLKLNLLLAMVSNTFYFYLEKAILPLDLQFVYPKMIGWVGLSSNIGLFALILLVVVSFNTSLFFFGNRGGSFEFRSGKIRFISLWCLFAFIPVSGIFYIPFMKFSFVSNRWFYLLGIGISLLMVELMGKAPSWISNSLVVILAALSLNEAVNMMDLQKKVESNVRHCTQCKILSQPSLILKLKEN